MGNHLLPHRHRKAQQRRALCLAQRRSAAHDRRSSRQPPRRVPALELAAYKRQGIGHVQGMDAYHALLADLATDDVAEQFPTLALEFPELKFLDRSKVSRAGVDRDAG